jgi:hypothetical protein
MRYKQLWPEVQVIFHIEGPPWTARVHQLVIWLWSDPWRLACGPTDRESSLDGDAPFRTGGTAIEAWSVGTDLRTLDEVTVDGMLDL